MRDVQAAIEERVFLYVWGRATYDDVFEGSKPHFFEFCHRIEVSGGAPNNLTLGFIQHGAHNGTDEDRPLHEPCRRSESSAAPRRSRAAASRRRFR